MLVSSDKEVGESRDYLRHTKAMRGKFVHLEVADPQISNGVIAAVGGNDVNNDFARIDPKV